ncbi:MAG: hypothetical protein ACI9UR_001960 [Bacteroidia bacterium]|jgi:hypothetical protein
MQDEVINNTDTDRARALIGAKWLLITAFSRWHATVSRPDSRITRVISNNVKQSLN